MPSKMLAGLFVGAGVLLTSWPSAAQVTAVGKTISTASDVGLPGHAPAAPTVTPYLPVGVPSGYKSKKAFLNVTTTIQVECDGVDSIATRVKVGSVYAEPTGSGLVVETNETNELVTRKWFLVPESQGGPAVPAGATVSLEVSSASGTGCAIGFGSLTAEAQK